MVKAAKDHGCNAVAIHVKLNRIHIYLGFIPSRNAQCDPYGPDPATAWMRNVPLGHDFHQPCLSVTTQVASTIQITAMGGGGDAEIEASPEDCNSGTNLACATVVDCDAEATNGAVPVAQKQVDPIPSDLNKIILPYFSSDGSAFENPGAGGKACITKDWACWLPYLSGSLAEISYGWFANAFTNLTYPSRHYPILDVRHGLTCPDGHVPSVDDSGQPVCQICDQAYGG